jgi:hypothetical protein
MPNLPGPCSVCGAPAAGHVCTPGEGRRSRAARTAAGAVLLVFAVIVTILVWLTSRLPGLTP